MTQASLADRSVLVTGASEGIGRGIALAVAGAGARVAVTALDLDAANKVVDEIRERGGEAIAAVCDVRKRADLDAAVRSALRAFGRIDCFVHNANSAGKAKPLEMASCEDWDEPVAVGLRAVYLCARSVLPALIGSRGSLIVLTSIAGVAADASMPIYSAVKGAQRGLVKSLAREWGPLGVRVNALSPSAFTPALAAYLEREPHMRTNLVERAALRRFGDPETDIGRVAAFLAGPDSAFVSGQTLMANGGALML